MSRLSFLRAKERRQEGRTQGSNLRDSVANNPGSWNPWTYSPDRPSCSNFQRISLGNGPEVNSFLRSLSSLRLSLPSRARQGPKRGAKNTPGITSQVLPAVTNDFLFHFLWRNEFDRWLTIGWVPECSLWRLSRPRPSFGRAREAEERDMRPQYERRNRFKERSD